MTFLLNSQNVVEYLYDKKLCDRLGKSIAQVELIEAKNFNLLVTFSDSRKLLVKQERHNHNGQAFGEFLRERQIQDFIQQFPEINHLSQFLTELLCFDREKSIAVFRYLDCYHDLLDFYAKEQNYSTKIAIKVGTIIGTIHRETFNCRKYHEFFEKNSDNLIANQVIALIQGLQRIEPEIFGQVAVDGLKFFSLYQRYDSLGQAIAQLGNAVIPSCLIHNDLKLNNILVHDNWENSSNNIIRLIDWERCTWGDPAFDLGTLISSYLQIWLNSLVISKSLNIEESLRLAMIPLENLQPSIAALTQAYLHTFPEIIQQHPNFLLRVVQFTGFGLIQKIQAMIQYQKTFSNGGIAMLQVAKTLLCRPQQSIPTIFGINAEFIQVYAA